MYALINECINELIKCERNNGAMNVPGSYRYAEQLVN